MTDPSDHLYICPYNNAVRNQRGELVPCGTDGNLCGDCANDAFEQYQDLKPTSKENSWQRKL